MSVLLLLMLMLSTTGDQDAAAGAQTTSVQTPDVPGLSPVIGAAPATYMIGPQDVLKITVFDEPDLSQSYRVDADGMISIVDATIVARAYGGLVFQ